jgi:hypothetical protein
VTTNEILVLGFVLFFVICQILNAFINILSHKNMNKSAEICQKIREDDSIEYFEKWETLDNRIQDIEKHLRDIQQISFSYQADILINIENEVISIAKSLEGKEKVIRGKYKPRMKKAIEHKKE